MSSKKSPFLTVAGVAFVGLLLIYSLFCLQSHGKYQANLFHDNKRSLAVILEISDTKEIPNDIFSSSLICQAEITNRISNKHPDKHPEYYQDLIRDACDSGADSYFELKRHGYQI